MTPDGTALLQVLRDARTALALEPEQWNGLLDCAKRQALLARLAVIFEDIGIFEKLPRTAQDLLADARAAARANHTMQRYEANRVLHALRDLGLPVVLLKGGAYLLAGLPPSRGRLSGDLDILVPRDRIDDVEQAMVDHGWQSLVTNSYDQRYYREWSHQIPPLRHTERDSELDVHHTIAPPTGRAKPNAQAIMDDALTLENDRLRILCPADMVLHSAVHLFNEQMTTTLRELLDMHDLLTHFGSDDGFWRQLMAHATAYRMQRPLYYCVRYCRRYLSTPVPDHAAKEIEALAPSALVRNLMDWLVAASLIHKAPDRASPVVGLACWLLFVRAHWLRMPLGMLLRHIFEKATRRAKPESESELLQQP